MTSGQTDAPNHRNGYRTQIKFMMRSVRNGQYRTERKRHQQRLLTIRAHLPFSVCRIEHRSRVQRTERLDTGNLIEESGDWKISTEANASAVFPPLRFCDVFPPLTG